MKKYYILLILCVLHVFIYKSSIYAQSISKNKTELLRKLESTKDSNEKKAIIKEIESIKKELGDSLIAEFEFFKLKNYYYSSEYEAALRHIDIVNNLFIKSDLNNRLNEVSIFESLINFKIGKREEALQILLKIDEKKLNDKSFYWANLGAIYYHFNDINKSLFYARKAEKEAKNKSNKKSLLTSYNLIAVNYSYNNDYNNAIKYTKNALEIATEIEDHLSEILCLNNLGTYYSDLKDFKQAQKYLLKAQPLIKNSKNKFINERNKHLLADTYFNLGNLNKAITLNNEVITNSEDSKNKDGVASAYLLRGAIFEKQGKFEEAKKNYLKAREIANEVNRTALESSAYFKLSNLHNKSNDYKTSLEYYKKHVSVEKKIDSLKLNEELKLLEIKNNISKYEQELQLKNQEIELLNLKNIKSYFQIGTLTAIAIGLLFFGYRQRKLNTIQKKNAAFENEINLLKQKSLENKVDFSGNQIVEFAIQIQDQNKILFNLKTKLSALLKNLKKTENTDEIKNLLFDINTSIEHNNEKIKLNTEIDNATNEFLFKLKNKFPALNQKEIQIVTYLKLNYKTKEIGSLLSVNDQTINNYRASIRKKLNISKEENISNFLQNI
ncbi:tetratricopeptide repeat protein [Flavobacterium sp. LMO8]|uniref:tetratricopeptide repeat protein n=1 Tax=Flavobacterium sp. LMO8 TaxID=2654244 RepID=UPI001396B127|nr:tetratricopeptide repeat protein [Flavobacterium sp. LMO8]